MFPFVLPRTQHEDNPVTNQHQMPSQYGTVEDDMTQKMTKVYVTVPVLTGLHIIKSGVCLNSNFVD